MSGFASDGQMPLDLVVQRSSDGWTLADAAGAVPPVPYVTFSEAEDAAIQALSRTGGRVVVRDGEHVLRVLTFPPAQDADSAPRD